jgi:hypothetical protein
MRSHCPLFLLISIIVLLIKSEGNEEKRSLFLKIFDPINSYAFYLRALSEREVEPATGGGKLGQKSRKNTI